MASDGYRYDQVPEDETQRTPGPRPGSCGSPQGTEPGVEAPEYAKVMRKVHKRHSTDLCTLCVFLGYWAGMCGITYSALKVGDPRRLIHSFDYGGRLCGVDAGVEGKGLLYWPNTAETEYAVCVSECPTDSLQTVSFPVEEADVQHGPDGSEVATITSREKKLPTYPSRQVGGRFCLPLTLADDMQHGRGRSSERSGNPPLPPTHVQLPRLPIATVTPSDRKPLPPSHETLPERSFPSAPTSPLRPSHQLHGEAPHPADPASTVTTSREEVTSTTKIALSPWVHGILKPNLPPLPTTDEPEVPKPDARPPHSFTSDRGEMPRAGPQAPTPQAIPSHSSSGNADEGKDKPEASEAPKPQPSPHSSTSGADESDEDKPEAPILPHSSFSDEGKDEEALEGHSATTTSTTTTVQEHAQTTKRPLDKHTALGIESPDDVGSPEHNGEISRATKGRQQLTEAEAEAKAEAEAFAKVFGHQVSKTSRRMFEDSQSRETKLAVLLKRQDQSAGTWLRELVWDIAGAWPVLLLNGVVLAALIGFGYLVFMKFCARPFTFVVPLMLLIADLGGALYFLFFVCKDEEKAAQVLGKFTDHPVLLSQVVGWSLAGLGVLLIVLLVGVFPKMVRAVGCIDCAGDAIWTSPLVRLPSLEILIKTLFSGMWLIFFSFVVSMGQIEPPTLDVNGTPVYTRLRQFGSTPLQKCYVLIYILGYFWSLETLSLIFHFAASFYVISWYFTPCRADGQKAGLDAGLWGRGVAYAIRYHLGSMALGAALTIIFRPIHAPMAVLAKLTKSGRRSADGIATHCLGCVWCFDEVVRFVNKNAVICMVFSSSGYFVAASEAVQALATAGEEVAYLNGSSGSLHSLGMLAAGCLSGYLSLLTIQDLGVFASQESSYYVENVVAVVIAAGLLAASVASCFMGLFDVVFDALIFSWLHDAKPTGNVVFAPKSLVAALGQPQGERDMEMDIEIGASSREDQGTSEKSNHKTELTVPTRKQLAQQEAEERAAHRRVAQEAEDKKAELLRKAAEDERTAMAAEAAKAAAMLQRENERAAEEQRKAEAAIREAAEMAAREKAAEEQRKAEAAIREAAEMAAREKAAEEQRKAEAAREAAEMAAREKAAEEQRKAEAAREAAEMAEREKVAEEEQKAEGALEEDKNDIEAAEKTLRDTADSKLKEEKEKEPEEMEKKTAKKKTTLTTMPSPKQDIFSDPLRAAEESDLLKAVGTTDPFGAEEEKAEKQEWIADFPDR